MKQKITLLAIAWIFSSGLFAQETLITAWTFDELEATDPGQTPLTIGSTAGVGENQGMIYADGSNGSSAFSNSASAIEITSFNGYVENDPRTPAVRGKALALANNSANGKSIVFKFPTTGYGNLMMSFAIRGTATGFSTHSWAYSTDGATFTSFDTENTAHTAGGSTPEIRTVDFSEVTALNDQENVYIRLTVDGATNATGNNRFDNIQFVGTSSGPDIYPPKLTHYEVLDPSSLKLTFNEALNPAVAQTTGNYLFADNLSVTSAVLSESRFVTLTVNPAFTEGGSYTLTISNIEDASENGNVMADSTFTFSYGVSSEYHKATLAELRAVAPAFNNAINNSDVVYKFTGEAVITYLMSNRNQKHIQDNTGAILIDDQAGVMATGFETGDKVTGIYGTLANYYGLVQFTPTEAGTTVGWNEVVFPAEVTVSEFDSLHTNPLQSQLVKVDPVSFSSSGTFATGTYYDLTQDGTLYPAVVFTNNYNADYISTEIPTYPVALTGVVTYSYNKNRLIILNQSAITSIEHYNAAAITLSPNPAVDFVNIVTGEEMRMEIYSLTGQLVSSDRLSAGNNLLSVSSLNSGVYLVKLTGQKSGNTYPVKLVVR